MSVVNLAHWCGGLGNNLEQIANAYWYAEESGGILNCILDHHILDVPNRIVFGGNTKDVMEEQYFTNADMMKCGMDVELKRFENYCRIMRALSPQIFRKIHPKKFDGLVVHIRAGNIYREPSVGRYLLQAPTSFFQKAIKLSEVDKGVLFITGSKHGNDSMSYQNPMLAEAIRYCKHHDIKYDVCDNEYESAISYLLHAEHAIITGYTTFSRMLLLANSNLKSVTIPLMGSWPHDDISFKKHGCETHYFSIKEYPKLWSVDAIMWQKNHPATEIEYLK